MPSSSTLQVSGDADAVTVIADVAATLPLRTDAVIVAVPIATACTVPSDATVATCGFDEVQATVSSTASPVESFATASSESDPPTASHAFAGMISRATEPPGGCTGSSSSHETASNAQARAPAYLRAKAAEITQVTD